MAATNLTWGSNTPASRKRLRELLLYIAKKTSDLADFGSIKVNKTLYHADMERFKASGKAITGVQYHRIQMGPVPKHVLVAERELANDLEVRPLGLAKIRLANREPDMSLFTEDEIASVDGQIERLKAMTSDEVSEDSHDIRWHTLQDKDLVPYEFAYLSDTLTAKDKEDAASLAERFGW